LLSLCKHDGEGEGGELGEVEYGVGRGEREKVELEDGS
jgi:hypothetical protein